MASKYVLNYFDVAGRAEPIRLAFHAAGVTFEDNRVPFSEWPALKSNAKKFPLGQMPTLEIDGKTVCQSAAILRYVGNVLDLYGSNYEDKVIVDQVMETLADLAIGMTKIMFDNSLDEDAKKVAYAEYLESKKNLLIFVVTLLKMSGGPFCLGDKVSIADTLLCTVYQAIVKVSPAILDQFPEISAAGRRVEEIPSIKLYLESKN